jgi:hypothetical protein
VATKKELEGDLESLVGEATVPEAPLEESQEAVPGT